MSKKSKVLVEDRFGSGVSWGFFGALVTVVGLLLFLKAIVAVQDHVERWEYIEAENRILHSRISYLERTRWYTSRSVCGHEAIACYFPYEKP